MRSTFLYWYLLRGFIKMNWTRRENILVESLFDLFRFYYYFLWFLIFSSLLRTILFYSISVETEFCSSSILFLGRVIYRGRIDINFLYFCISCRKRYKELFSYIYLYFYSVWKYRWKEWCENEIFIILWKILSYVNWYLYFPSFESC